MNQYGLVEIVIIKNDYPYRALLPLGTSWIDAKAALLEMVDQIDGHIKTVELQQKESQEDSAA